MCLKRRNRKIRKKMPRKVNSRKNENPKLKTLSLDALMLDAIVLCAGSSVRFNAKESGIKESNSNAKIENTGQNTEQNTEQNEAKVLANLGGKPALEYLLQTLVESPFVRNCVFVLPEDDAVKTKIKELVQRYADAGTSGGWSCAQGGARRQDSLKNGLQLLCKDKALAKAQPQDGGKDWCMVCDAARPLLSHALLERIATAVAHIREKQSLSQATSQVTASQVTENKVLGVIPLLPIADSVKRIDGKGFLAASIERETLRLAQTPQAFPTEKLLEWLLQAEKITPRKNFADEAQLAVENLAQVAHVQGEARAHKITTPQDILFLEGLLAGEKSGMTTEKTYSEKPQQEKQQTAKQQTEFRSCSAFDQHKVSKGIVLRLCATDIPCGFALEGHSDADVVLHALTDAILALAGSGDIGEHFPPSEQRWRNADSAIFLKHAIKVLTKAGGKLINADVTILAEKPNLTKYKPTMRQKLAQLTELDGSRIGLKATTLEGLGELGKAKGIAAYATATAKFF